MSDGSVRTRLCAWSGPRSLSTALMYSFAQREDTRVVDEPLYGHYLSATGVDHPGREEVLAAQSTSAEEVVREVILGPSDRPVLFVKNMAHHMVGVDWRFLADLTNFFLIRDPRDLLASLSRTLPEPELRDTGYRDLHAIFAHVTGELGQPPVVVDSRELRNRPRAVLAELCRRVGLEFDPAMLSWEPGPIPEDGVWAEHWYDGVHASTGFRPYRPKDRDVPERLSGLLETCLDHYERMAAHAIRPESDGGITGAGLDTRAGAPTEDSEEPR